MNILITGANGFVGQNLVSALQNIKEGKDRTRPELDIGDLYLYDVDTDPALLDVFCQKADFVFHLAGVNRPKNNTEFMEGNRDFFSKLLSLLQEHKNTCPVMLSSSVQATLSGRFAGSLYGESKLAGEKLAFEHAKLTGAKVYVYRFPNLFGKWCRPNYNSAIATFCYNVSRCIPLQINDPSIEMQLAYIDDVVEELLNALAGNPAKEGDFCCVPTTHCTPVGVLADTISGFAELREKMAVPDFDDPLTYKLYSTYLSYLPEEKFIYDLKMNCDNRGSFTEIIRTPNRGQFSVNISRPGITKGNHWHHSKNEKFLVVKGTGLIQMRRVGTDNDGNPYPVIEFHVNGDKLQVVEMIPGYTHNIVNLSKTEDLVTFMWANECFNPQKPDTFFEAVE